MITAGTLDVKRESLNEAFTGIVATVARDEGFIKDDHFKSVREDVIRAVWIVNGYIRYLVEAKSHSRVS